MTARPRRPHGGSGGDGEEPPDHHGGGGDDGGDEPPTHRAGGSPGPGDYGSVRQAEDGVARVARVGRSTPTPGWSARPSSGAGNAVSPPTHPDDARLQSIMRKYDQLGDAPPKFKVAAKDDRYKANKAHTIDNHGPDIPLSRDPNSTRTIEGRIYGDSDWDRAENQSIRWTDHTTMNREINDFVARNWTEIRSRLAVEGQYSGAFNAGHRVGEGFYNDGMYGAGPRRARYTAASLVRVTINLAAGTDPPEPFILTAYPAVILPPGLL